MSKPACEHLEFQLFSTRLETPLNGKINKKNFLFGRETNTKTHKQVRTKLKGILIQKKKRQLKFSSIERNLSIITNSNPTHVKKKL